jgi:hypothetical protein
MVEEKSLRLLTVPESLSRTAMRTRDSVIFFEFEKGFFPSEGWIDLAPDFSYAWLNAVMRIASGVSDSETVFFMDGPYVVELKAERPGFVYVHFFEDRPQGKIDRGGIRCSAKDLLEDAIFVMQRLRDACAKNGWQVDPAAVTSELTEATDLLSKLQDTAR